MEWIIAIVSYIVGILSGYAIKVIIDVRINKYPSSTKADAKDHSVAQSGNVAGGHIAGGDVNTRSE